PLPSTPVNVNCLLPVGAFFFILKLKLTPEPVEDIEGGVSLILNEVVSGALTVTFPAKPPVLSIFTANCPFCPLDTVSVDVGKLSVKSGVFPGLILKLPSLTSEPKLPAASKAVTRIRACVVTTAGTVQTNC